jgi:dTDP-4-amino-4,6-dideoxygalactose transaminase
VPVAVPVAEDLNVSTEHVVGALDQSALAVIPVHMYGHVARGELIHEAALSVGAATIDDAAHVMGVCDPAGYVPGTAGTFGLISFAQAKSIACGYSGSGGLLIVNDPGIGAEIRSIRLADAQHADIFNFLLKGRRTCATLNQFWRFEHYFDQQVKRERNGFDTQVTKIANLHAALALAQMMSLPSRIDDKRRVAAEYAEALSGLAAVSFPQYAPGRYLSRIMLRSSSIEARNRLRSHLQSHRIATRAGYPPPDVVMSIGNPPRELPLLEVPSGFGLTRTDIRHVVAVIAEFAARVQPLGSKETSHPSRRSMSA